MKPVPTALAGALAIGAFLGIWLASKPANKHLTPAESARLEKSRIDANYNAPNAKEEYTDFIAKHRESPDRSIQDQVGSARLRLAFLTAKGSTNRSAPDYAKERARALSEARTLFLETAAQDKGSGSMSSDFGGIKDQALYQAAVCLSAQGLKSEARTAFLDFIKAQPLSPLVNACYKRIVRLDGKSNTELEALLQHALDLQQQRIRYNMSMCGPKAVAYLLKAEGRECPDLDTLAQECGRTDEGTNLDGLRKCLRLHGEDMYGFQIARADLSRLACPAILFTGDHFLVVTSINDFQVITFDPMLERENKLAIKDLHAPGENYMFLLKSAPRTLVN